MEWEYWKKQAKNALIFARWCVFAVVIGVVVGVTGTAFHHALDWAGRMREQHDWLLYLLPLAGVFIAFWYKKSEMPLERGTNFILTSVRENHPVRLRLAPSIFVTSVLTHLCGGSAGREGAALQLGGSISGNIGHWMRLDDRDSRTITMCGMAAGFSALFGTPLAAAVMSMEVVSVGVMYYSAIVPCVLSALIAQVVASAMGIEATSFQVTAVPQMTPLTLVQVGALGILCALVAVLFCGIMHLAPKGYDKITKNPYLRVVLGGCIVVVLSLLLGTDYNGAGVAVINRAMEGNARPEAFLLKIIFTALTLAAGFKGGEIVPAFFCGAAFGAFYGQILGLGGSFAASLGMTAVFCGVTNCPLTSILLSYELFGGQGLPMYALCCALSYMLSGYSGLYHAQKIVYSKLRPEYINKGTH